jgi:hypothetical protein
LVGGNEAGPGREKTGGPGQREDAGDRGHGHTAPGLRDDPTRDGGGHASVRRHIFYEPAAFAYVGPEAPHQFVHKKARTERAGEGAKKPGRGRRGVIGRGPAAHCYAAGTARFRHGKGRAGRRVWAGATEGIVIVAGPGVQTRRARCDGRIRFPTEPAKGRAQQCVGTEAVGLEGPCGGLASCPIRTRPRRPHTGARCTFRAIFLRAGAGATILNRTVAGV